MDEIAHLRLLLMFLYELHGTLASHLAATLLSNVSLERLVRFRILGDNFLFFATVFIAHHLIESALVNGAESRVHVVCVGYRLAILAIFCHHRCLNQC